MKLIPLTQGQFAKVDDEDYDDLSRYKWCARFDKDIQSFYAEGYFGVVDGKYKHQSMHRRIMQTPKGMVCDHIDHDTLNNQKSNLRNVTPSQNSMNRKSANKGNKTGVCGVTIRGSGFRVIIAHPLTKRNVSLGTYNTLDEATRVRLKAEKEYYGEIAK
jgi:hypothetical protein